VTVKINVYLLNRTWGQVRSGQVRSDQIRSGSGQNSRVRFANNVLMTNTAMSTATAASFVRTSTNVLHGNVDDLSTMAA
jgi:transcriptional regulator of nitric oxide reductase